MLEIVVSGSEELLLQETELFNEEDVISFSLLLCYGKIQNIKTTLVRKICGYTINVQEELKLLNEKLTNKKKVRIWYSSLDNEDVCTLCFIINYLSDRYDLEIYACDVYNKEHFSLGSYMACEVNDLIKNTKRLVNEERKRYEDLWNKLEFENGDLRIVFNNTLVSRDYDYLDSKIIEILRKYDSIYYWSFVGECLSLRLCNFYGDMFFTERINQMIKNCKIKVCKVVKENNFLGEIIEKKYIKVFD